MLTRLFGLQVFLTLTILLAATFMNSRTRADDLDNIVFEGVVRDSNVAVVAAVQVVAVHIATGVEHATISSDEGRFRISVGVPGNYKIKARASGFNDQETEEIAAIAGRTFRVDLTLTPAGMSEQLVVVAGSPSRLVDTNRTVVGDTITERELDELPIVNRDPLQLVFLLGGVTEAPLSTAELADEGRGVFLRGTPEEAGLFSLTGASATSNNLTIDGLDNNDDRSATPRIRLSPESIADVQVITNQYAAEYGRASGGRINVSTRSGSNRFRGSVYSYFGDEALNANTFFRNARGLGRIPEQRRREGGNFSGPIREQRDFFFTSYERLDVPDFVEISAFLPISANPLFPLPKPNQPFPPGNAGLFSEQIATPETLNTFNARADLNFSQSHNFVFRVDAVRGENDRAFPGGTRLPETILRAGRDSSSVGVSDSLVFANRFLNQARFQYSRLMPRSSATQNSTGLVINSPRVTAGFYTGSDSSPAFSREEKRTQIQDNISIMVGNHFSKAGVDAQLVRSSFEDLFAVGGQYTFETVDDFLANKPSRFVQRFNTKSSLINNVLGVYVQDEWKIAKNVTVSMGMRWDNESILDDRRNFSPRLAIAWDPFGGKVFSGLKGLAEPGKTVIRAGFGLFYNRALLRTLDDFALGKSTLIVDSNVNPQVLSHVNFPQPVLDRMIIEEFGLTETRFLRRVSKDLEIPYTLQTGLGLERQLNRRLVAGADYIFTRGTHLWRESNINAPVLPVGFHNFTEYLLSRDFDNRPESGGQRPISGATADVVRFDTGSNTSSTQGAIRVENGVRIMTLGLNAPRSSNITAALNAVRFLRPNPSLTQVELLESTGNSFYHAGMFSVRYSGSQRLHFRAVYTLSKFIDEGTTNTASPQDLFDRRAERALSLQDQRHRLTLSGVFRVPVLELELSPIISFGSSKPFNIGAGFDRNLNDIENDRPSSNGEFGRPQWRRPGSESQTTVESALSLAPIGSNGNLPRNYGVGPGTQTLNLRVSRGFALSERMKLRTSADVYNVFNNTVFSFGSEFVDRDDADFLEPRRTQRPRTVELSLKLYF
jgi:carboxypeptidase family protein/TonB-dependent receptor-like protein